MTDQNLLKGLDASDTLGQTLYLLGEAVKTAREPIENNEWDFVTIRGELTDMQEYLRDAERQNYAVRNSFVELITLVRRLQSAYHAAYEAQQAALDQAATAYHQGQTAMLRRIIVDLNDDDMDLLHSLACRLSTSDDGEHVIRQYLTALLTEGARDDNQD